MHLHFWGYVLRRALWAVTVFVILCYAYSATIYGYLEVTLKERIRGDAYELVKQMPGVTAQNMSAVTEELYQTLLKKHQMDGPIAVRIHNMAVRLLSFNFGETRSNSITTTYGYPHQRTQRILPIVAEASIITVSLFGTAYLVQLGLGLLIGLRHASRRQSSRLTMLMGVTLQGMSTFTLSLLAVFLFAYSFRLHPTDPWVIRLPWTYGESVGPWLLDLAHHFWLPFAVLVFAAFWQTAYMVEKLALGTSAEEHVDAARARGMPEKSVRYGIIPRTNAPALVTMAVQGLFVTLWGSFIIERIFSVPGVGSLFLMALEWNERFLAAGVLISVTLVLQVGLFLLDVSYGFLDPRIRVGAKAGALR